MKKTTFYLIRHGQTDWNLQKKIQGHTDIPLNETGRLESVSLGKKLQGITFAAYYSSDLTRAIETAYLIPAPNVKIDVRLRERYFANWEGLVFTEFQNAPEEEKVSAESVESLRKRAYQFLDEKAMEHAGENVLVVTHGGFMRHVIQHLINVTHIETTNTGILQLIHEQNTWSIHNTDGIHIA